MTTLEQLKRAAQSLLELGKPEVAVVLGSGLSEVVPLAEERKKAFGEIPGFPVPSIAGHRGEVAVGEVQGRTVLVQRGRVHLYEGRTVDEIVFPVRSYALMGVRTVVLTNASGGIAHGLEAGDIVLISDHINMLGDNPLRGPNLEELGPRFPDMTYAYDPELRKIARQVAQEIGLGVKEGVYLATLGPSYETPAEIRAFRALGADLVGMSTVPEAIAARHAGLKVLGISLVTNLAAGVLPTPLSHEEVLETSRRRAGELGRFLTALLPKL